MSDTEYAAILYADGSGPIPEWVPTEMRNGAEPVIRYARTTDGVNIAYYAVGDGAPPLVYLTPVSHLEREWQYPEQRAWLELLAQNHYLIRLDFRGTGLSDRDRDLEIDLLPLDIASVVRKEGIKRFALGAGLSAAAGAILFACRFPEMVSHLVLWCPYGGESVDSAAPLQAVRAGATKDWSTFTQILAELLTGWQDMDQARRYAAYMYECVDADQFLRFSEQYRHFDLTPKLRELTVPVLVLQRRQTVFPTIETAQKVAANTPGARLVLVEGQAVLPFLGDTDAVLSPILNLLAEANELRPDGLTARELEILTRLAGGASNEEIALALSISKRTAERHISNIYSKIGAHNRAEATAYTFRRLIAPAL
jgi:pimeloyl-ACP methyl ester carboxylesterase